MANESIKRVIVDFNKLSKELQDLLINTYPDGYDNVDLIAFNNSNNEVIKCVELRSPNTIYLVKVSKETNETFEDYDLEAEEGSLGSVIMEEE